jgi:predicted DNA-binding transcriptional regulator AlpA
VKELPENPKLIMTPQAAEIVGVSRQALHKMLAEFPKTTRIGTFPLFDRAEVEAWAKVRHESQAPVED